MDFSEIALIVSGVMGAVGWVGWIFAWRSRGEAAAALGAANAATVAAKDLAFSASARAVVGETQLSDERRHSEALTTQLAAERAHVQALIDALAKAGVPVGDLVVGHALDGLYPDGGGQGANPVSGGGSSPVSGAPAPVTGTAKNR